MRTLLSLALFLLAAACAVHAQNYTELVISDAGLACESVDSHNKNCLSGTTMTITPTVLDERCGHYRIQYNFRQPDSCQVSNFVLDLPVAPVDVTGCASPGHGFSSGNLKDCAVIFSNIQSPYKIEIEQNSQCPKEDFSVAIEVKGASLGWAPMGIKGGTNCQLCQINAWVVTALRPTCAVDSDCDDGNACTTDICDGDCGVCSNIKQKGCTECDADEDCASLAVGDPCGERYCSAGKCARRVIAGCTECTTDADCTSLLQLDPAKDCASAKCGANDVCYPYNDGDCCAQAADCASCVAKRGCVFASDSAANSSACVLQEAASGASNTTEIFFQCPSNADGGDGGNEDGGDGGSGGDGGDKDTGKDIGIGIAAAAAGGGLLLAAGAGAAAGAAFWMKKAKQRAITQQLASVGFNDQEIDFIMNSPMYKASGAGDNPFFIERGQGADVGSMIKIVHE